MVRAEINPRYLLADLKNDGLRDVSVLPDRSLLLRLDAAVPFVRIHEAGEELANTVDIKMDEEDGKWVFHIEHPNPGEVMHPNWDGNGYWQSAKAKKYQYSGMQSLVELLRYMLGGLQMKTSCISLEEGVNRNAVQWCYTHGTVPIKVIRIDRESGGKEKRSYLQRDDRVPAVQRRQVTNEILLGRFEE